MGWFGWFGSKVSDWLGIGGAISAVEGAASTFLEQLSRLKEYARLGLQIALLFTASISSFFVGLFLSVGGLDYLLLIDKSSMLASLFIYTAVLSSVTMIVTFIPSLVTSNGLFVAAARALGLIGFSIYIIGLEHTVLLAVLAGCILLWAWLRQGRNGSRREAHRNLEFLKIVASVLLFCCLAFGYLRGEHLRERPPSMVVHLADAVQAAVPVTVIMSSDQGVLVFQPPYPEPRFYPWNRISWMASAPEHRGISQSLRDWLHAARGWVGGIPATVRGWMGATDPPVAATPTAVPQSPKQR
jgi:hypothetical protein